MQPQILTLRPTPSQRPQTAPGLRWLRSLVDLTMLVAVMLLVAAALAACGNPTRAPASGPVVLAVCDSPVQACPTHAQAARRLP